MASQRITSLPLVAACSLVMTACTTISNVTPSPPAVTPAPATRTAAPSPIPTATATPGPTPSPTARPTGYSTDPSRVLLRLEDLACTTVFCAVSRVVFALYGDGLVAYRAVGQSPGKDVRLAQLDVSAVKELLAFATDAMQNTDSATIPSGSATAFDIYTDALQERVEVASSKGTSVAPLERRLRAFDAEIGDRAIFPAGCSVTPLGTIARNDVVVWDQPIWQDTGAGVWAAPLDAFDPEPPTNYVGFPSSAQSLKVLWWTPAGDLQPLQVHITRIPDGVGSGLTTDLTLKGDPVFPTRADRPSGIPGLPPGCYEFAVTFGSATGSLIEQVTF